LKKALELGKENAKDVINKNCNWLL
jgi:hypothetical protein